MQEPNYDCTEDKRGRGSLYHVAQAYAGDGQQWIGEDMPYVLRYAE